MLNHDRDGFLISDATVGIEKLTSTMREIRGDISDLLTILRGQNRPGPRNREATVQRMREATIPRADRTRLNPPDQAGPRQRDERGRFLRQPGSDVERTVRQMTRQQAERAANEDRADNARRGRDQARGDNGRFGGGSDAPDGLLKRLKSALSGGGGSDMGDIEKVDPTIAAANELKTLVGGPLKALGSMGGAMIGRGFGGGDAQDRTIPWFKRLLAQLKLARQDDGAFQRAELRRLEEIRNGGGGGGGGESPGFFGTLMGTIFGRIGPMILAGLATVGTALLAGIGTVLGIIFSPIGLAIGAAAALAWGLFTEDGRKFFSTIGTRIAAGWDIAVQEFSKIWKPISDFLKDKFGIVVDAAAKVVAPVVDAVKEKVAPVVAAITEKVTPVVKAIAEKAAPVVAAVKEAAAPAVEVAGNVIDATKGLFGKGSKGNKAALVQGMQQAGITDPKEQASFMSQMDHESGGFRTMSENLNYSAKGLRKTFPKYFKTDAEAQAAAAAGPETIANTVYGGRMGNTAPGDGFAFRGRGFTQLTGKDNYTAASKATGLDLVNNPDLASNPDNAAKIATWYWQSRKGLSEAGKAGDVTAATKLINGGTNGLSDRKSKYADYLAAAPNGSAIVPSMASTAPMVGAGSVAQIPAMNTMTIPPMYVRPNAAPPQAPSPTVATQVNSRAPLEVTIRNEQKIGQDVPDRRIAAVASGIVS